MLASREVVTVGSPCQQSLSFRLEFVRIWLYIPKYASKSLERFLGEPQMQTPNGASVAKGIWRKQNSVSARFGSASSSSFQYLFSQFVKVLFTTVAQLYDLGAI
jgi:hypothetical protein